MISSSFCILFLTVAALIASDSASVTRVSAKDRNADCFSPM